MRRSLVILRLVIVTLIVTYLGALSVIPAGSQVTAPAKADSVRMAVIGDMGTGGEAQYELAHKMAGVRQRFSFDFVLMLGDNLYGG